MFFDEDIDHILEDGLIVLKNTVGNIGRKVEARLQIGEATKTNLFDFYVEIRTWKRKDGEASWKVFHRSLTNSEFTSRWCHLLDISKPQLGVLALECMKEVITEDYDVETGDEPMNPTGEEYDIISYIGGYVIRKMTQKMHKIQKCNHVSCLNLMSDLTNVTKNAKLLNCQSRGGLTIPTETSFLYFLELENCFRKCSQNLHRKEFKRICEKNAFSLFLQATKECDVADIKHDLHDKAINIYFSVRVHRHMKNLTMRFNKHNKSKGLRKTFKKKSECS
ncbi:Uncharacterised protein r2_g549 [Pycnogonum litorale]